MKLRDVYIRNITYGAADGLVSTVGLLAGMGISGTLRSTIILTGVIYAFVEALSMAAGSFLSEESVEVGKRVKKFSWTPYIAGTVMFFAFALSAFIPLAPYMTKLTPQSAIVPSVILSLIALFITGLMVGLFARRVSRRRLVHHAIKMVLLGGGAIILGLFIGRFFEI